MSTLTKLNRRAVAGVTGTAGLAAAALAVGPLGQLVAHFNISPAVAAQIIALVGSGGVLLDFLFPWVLPVLGTIQAILLVAGTGAAIGW